jgi:hypothetical protein
MTSSTFKIWATCCLLATTLACDKFQKKHEDKSDVPNTKKIETIDAKKSKADILVVKATVRRDGIMLDISDLPKDSILECDLNNKPLTPCHDGALFALPDPGEYSITAVATVKSKIAALGSSKKFIILPADGIGGNQDEKNPLNLVLDDSNFKQNMAWRNDQDFTVRWKFFKKPICQPVVKCRYPSKQSPFWITCSEDGRSFTFPKETMATGLQFLTVQASCDNIRGPELNLQWYGVPVSYEPLMIQDASDSNDRHILNLIKSDDCSSYDELRFVCSRTTGEDFKACENGNVVDNPQPGFRIRATCGSKIGPPISF